SSTAIAGRSGSRRPSTTVRPFSSRLARKERFDFHLSPFTFHLSPFTFHLSPCSFPFPLLTSSTPPATPGHPAESCATDQSAGVAQAQSVLQDVRLPRTRRTGNSLRSRPFPRPCPERFALFPAAS